MKSQQERSGAAAQRIRKHAALRLRLARYSRQISSAVRSCRKISDTDCAGYFSYFSTTPKYNGNGGYGMSDLRIKEYLAQAGIRRVHELDTALLEAFGQEEGQKHIKKLTELYDRSEERLDRKSVV